MHDAEIKAFADAMLPHYLACAAWATGGEEHEGETLDSLERFEFSDDARQEAAVHCLYFCTRAWPWLNSDHGRWTAEQTGHDLFLSRNGHGAGFFDRKLPFADLLQEKAQAMGGHEPYLGDTGLIYF